MNKGFTLIEVIISITIIGIMTSIMIPTYKNFNKTSDELIVKEKTMVIQNEIMTFINRQLLNKNQTYPIIGLQSTSYLGVNNVSSNSLVTFVRGIMTYSNVLDINSFIKITTDDFSGFKDGIGYIDVKMTYKSGEYIIINFKIVDNQVNYKDVATIYSVTYYNSEGLNYKAMM